MNLIIREITRCCTVERDERPTPAKSRDRILKGDNVATGFSLLTAPTPARDQTAFEVCGNDRELLIAVAMYDALPAHITYDTTHPMRDELEIYFNFNREYYDWHCFRFLPDGSVQTSAFLPQPEAHFSSFSLPKLRRHRNELERFGSSSYEGWRCRWVYAWFDMGELFGDRKSLGFNICRTHAGNGEFSAWNFLSGTGGPDATSFGRLSRNSVFSLASMQATLENGTLRVQGEVKGALDALQLRLKSPLGEEKKTSLKIRGEGFSGSVKPETITPGRYLLTISGGVGEPLKYAIDIPSTGKPRDFLISMTYDPPMSLMPNYYTPVRLHQEMQHLTTWGVRRLYWIDNSNFDTLWADKLYEKNYEQMIKHCGDFLTCATQQAHANGLEIFACLKVFDLGFNSWFQERRSRITTHDVEGLPLVVTPEVAAHPEWTLQTNPAWRRTTKFPITRLRFYSEEPIPALKPSQIRLRASRDNKDYQYYSGPLQFKQGTVRRRHQRWTPAGPITETGTTRNWYIELAGLQLNQPFAALEITDQPVALVQRAFMLVEAEDASGALAPVTVATQGGRNFKAEGYFFWKEWDGWNNYTDPIVQRRIWNGSDLALTFQEMPTMPSMLEPTYEGTRDIWLALIQKEIEAGVDGISIRTLCHHNGVMSWLQYAFAPIVVETFQSRYGRAPQCTPEDYERVRRLRGDCFTQFLRDAKKLLAAYGKKLSFQLEPGIEIPVRYATPMQLFFDYETWLHENIVDELELKWWTAHSTFIHNEVLPLAHRQGVPVHLISRCITSGLGYGEMNLPSQWLTDAYSAGFDGYNYYETDNLIEMNPAGASVPKGYAEPAMTAAYHALRTLQHG